LADKQQEDITYIREKIDKIHDCLYVGNGNPPVMTRLKVAEIAIARNAQRLESHGENWSEFAKTLLRDVLTSGVMAIVVAIVLSKLI
jgi:hypothetical protein